MPKTSRFIPAVFLTAVAAGGIGFAASHVWDSRTAEKLTVERDQARDCRRTGATAAPCPVIYRNTKIEWRDRIETVQKPDPRQTSRITFLSAALDHAQRTIRNLERRRTWVPATALAYPWQNGTMQHPYTADAHCPAGSAVIYEAGFSGASRHFGDPNVCYVLKLHRLALTSPSR